MANSKNLAWAAVERTVEQHCRAVMQNMLLAEEAYQDLLEARTANGGTDQGFANQLFGGTASADQVAVVADARVAMVAVHDLYLALTNTTITASDKAALLRRMI